MLSHAGQVRITDFGLASVEGGVDLTRPQAVLGTPAYMSPEQVRGERTDGRTDVWSFGCLLFEMTTGRRPFLGEHGRAVANEILNEAPPDPVSLRAEFPTGLAEVVLKCLSKDPSDRYPDFESVLEALGSERIGPQGQPPPRGARQAKKPIPPGYPDSLVTLGDHIRKRRLDLKLTIKELGRRLGADDTTIYLWETNRAKPAIAHVSKIIQFLGYDPGISAIKTIGDTIRSFRRIHGFSQRRLGALTGIDFTAIGTWERGKHKPTKKQLDKLRTFFVSFKKP
jgi:serine/threonine protein kinase